jgi:hypothetical protein
MMKKLAAAFLAVCAVRAVPTATAGMVEEWDQDQTRAVRDLTYPLVARLPDGATLRATLDGALSGDPSVVPDLITLMGHSNDDVAVSAAKLLGRFLDPRASVALKRVLAEDPRPLMRSIALASLGRMRDPGAATLALAALSSADDYMKGAGGTALGLIGDNTNTPAILDYLDSMASRGILDTGAFDILAELGDPPGSTAARDRLLAEANKKTNDFDDRLQAALALKKMGLAQLVIRLLDRSDALDTRNSITTLKGAITAFAAGRGIQLRDQASLDGVLARIDEPSIRSDSWGRLLRARFVSIGIFDVVCDGPDRTPNTADDMSTAEPFPAYDKRVFADLF